MEWDPWCGGVSVVCCASGCEGMDGWACVRVLHVCACGMSLHVRV